MSMSAEPRPGADSDAGRGRVVGNDFGGNASDSSVDVAALFEPGRAEVDGELLRQEFGAACCVFWRVAGRSALICRLAGVSSAERSRGGGWLFEAAGGKVWSYWLPALPMWRRIDTEGRVREERSARLKAAGWVDGQAAVTLDAPPAGWVVDLALWRLPGALADELRRPLTLETQSAYLWGSHTVLGSAADLHRHLVHGRVHENRWSWPLQIRVFSENDGHAIGVQVAGLRRATGSALQGLLGRQVMRAVIDRIGTDGAYRHGVWTDGMESHYRLHCSAMHLMMDTLAEAPHPDAARALASASAFLARQHVELDIGTWFLHDDLEHSVDSMRLGPIKWVPSTRFGKAESNMLVLNSHLDATVALDRYAEVTGDRQYAALVESARSATRSVLGVRPAEPLYRALFWLIGLTFLPTARAAALPLWKRALKRLTWQVLIPRLPDVKARFPRWVMPGGYIDRELTLRTWAHDYHAINLMDLSRYLRRFDDPLVRQVLLQGLDFTRRSGILERWRELGYQKYALGFWAEALYHVCTLFPDARYRQWLAEAMLVLEDLQMGQPPSVLGANAEAVPVADQLPCPSPADARLRVANLGRRGAPELLVVNPADDSLPLVWESAPAFPVTFHSSAGLAMSGAPLRVPARGWVWGQAAQ